ncbi:ChaN family lipoprotein [Roseovarius sp. MMSF_3281]|uniref:ChaN family lipoprotein n=1 Tax=Roseovarius sp. MMSF_3281 TaxID=3046694 RepID=UPI00274013E5|nr:ChaN family lipoprotein [Roseovarius sp. MMSF_3281]
MIRLLAFAFAVLPCAPAFAQDVLVIGEVHDNPRHHEVQAELIAEFKPAALVFEMVTAEQAARVTPDLRANKSDLGDALDWSGSGWPDFSMYYPIFAAAPQARVYGAQIPQGVARAAFDSGIVEGFNGDAERFGLTKPLPEAQQEEREAMQMAAHCDALPQYLLPTMVDIQRLRDAELARVAVRAMNETGGPVAVITGNGHARRDWGMPVYLQRAAPDLSVHVVGQAEEGGVLHGVFDEVISAQPVNRPDPCAAFQ